MHKNSISQVIIVNPEDKETKLGIMKALSFRHIDLTFKIIMQFHEILMLNDFDIDKTLVNCKNLIRRYQKQGRISLDNIKTKYGYKDYKNPMTLDNILKTICTCLVNGYNICNLVDYRDMVCNKVKNYRNLHIKDIESLVKILTFVDCDDNIKSEVSKIKRARAILDEKYIGEYRNNLRLHDISLYMIINKDYASNELLSNIIRRNRVKQINEDTLNCIKKNNKYINIDKLKLTSPNLFKLYMDLNPIIECNGSIIVLDTKVMYTMPCEMYVNSIIKSINKQNDISKLHQELGEIQENIIGNMLLDILNIKLVKIPETITKTPDFTIMLDGKEIHIESKFDLIGTTTHWRKSTNERKAFEQLKNYYTGNCINIVVTTGLSRNFIYTDSNGVEYINLSVLGLLGFMYAIKNKIDTKFDVNDPIICEYLGLYIMYLYLIEKNGQ